MKKLFLLVLIGFFLVQMACTRGDEARLQKILSSNKPPVGVVFEIASGDGDGLKWAIPMVQSYAKQLREKFPGIELAVVSHGEELFQLTRDNRPYFAETHRQVQSLVEDQSIEVHVCGNYAASSGVSEDEFVDYVDVAERGPVQVRAYINAGYELLFIRQPAEQINISERRQ
ncbi:MAG: DsrE family protein [Gammaproteobacteria bacterium]